MNIRQLFLNNLAQTTGFPLCLEVVKAEGSIMYGKNGERWLDLISGIGVSNVGHCHPEVKAAIHQQVEEYLHLMVYGEVVQTPQVAFAIALKNTLPAYLNSVYFTNSGSEAIEGAIKVAKRATGRYEVVSCFKAYHGSSTGALAIGGSEHFKQNYRPLMPGIRQIRFGVFEDLELITKSTACVVIETVQGEAGVRIASPEYFKALRTRCNEMGVVLISDEIQCGMGRTGTFWAFEQKGFVPDILVTAKALGGGMPIGAFIAPAELMAVIKNRPLLGHITTFGGHPVSCAAGMAALNVIIKEHLHYQANDKAELFKTVLTSKNIKEIRNAGLMMAVQLNSFDEVKSVIDRGLESGIFTDWFLYEDAAIRIAPPLNITGDEILFAAHTLNYLIDSL